MSDDAASPEPKRGKPLLLLWAFAVACVAIPGLFFWQTWYGARLDDSQLEAFLAVEAKPDRIRHAITEVTKRLDEGAAGMDRWADRLVAVSRSTDESVRLSAAWAMQFDPGRPAFHERLLEMLAEPSILTRQNAATSLAAGGDAAGLEVLRAMLAPLTVAAPRAGTVDRVLGRELPVRAGASVCRVMGSDGEFEDALAPVPGRVLAVEAEAGTSVSAGDPVVVIGPDQEQVFNAVTALALVGTPEDVPALKRVADTRSGYPERVRNQAASAAARLSSR